MKWETKPKYMKSILTYIIQILAPQFRSLHIGTQGRVIHIAGVNDSAGPKMDSTIANQLAFVRVTVWHITNHNLEAVSLGQCVQLQNVRRGDCIDASVGLYEWVLVVALLLCILLGTGKLLFHEWAIGGVLIGCAVVLSVPFIKTLKSARAH